MTTGYDTGQIHPCPDCGQALPLHLSVCPALAAPSVDADTIAAEEQQEKNLGQAV